MCLAYTNIYKTQLWLLTMKSDRLEVSASRCKNEYGLSHWRWSVPQGYCLLKREIFRDKTVRTKSFCRSILWNKNSIINSVYIFSSWFKQGSCRDSSTCAWFTYKSLRSNASLFISHVYGTYRRLKHCPINLIKDTFCLWIQ